MILCKHCGWPVNHVLANCFEKDGSDRWHRFAVPEIEECPAAALIDLPPNWCGADLSHEERMDCIQCPHCHKFPFSEKEEICVETHLVVTCFEEGYGGHEEVL